MASLDLEPAAHERLRDVDATTEVFVVARIDA
jgi:hypothetical protein